MKIYIAVIDDRHADTEPYAFSTAEQAIEYAKGWAKGAAHYEGDYEESPVKGWLFHASYSPESDSVWVVERELDDPDFKPAAVPAVPSETGSDQEAEEGN